MGVSSKTYTAATAGERLIRFRVRSPNVPGAPADTEIVTPFKGRIKRVLCTTDGDPTSDWIANVVTPQGTSTGAIDWSDVGHANIAARDVIETVFDPSDSALEVEVGDRIQIATTQGITSVTSIYGWMIIG